MKIIIELKAKSVAENNFFDFTQTNDALAELSASLQNLENLLAVKSETAAKENKKQAQALKESEIKLSLLRETSEGVLGKMDSLINKLDNVLENNGTSHDNN